MLNVFSALAVVGLLMSATPAQAQSSSPSEGYGEETPKELFEGATRMMMKALELLITTMPQYEAPVVLENGDILIRRSRPDQKQSDPDGADALTQDRI